MNELWHQIVPLFTDTLFYVRVMVGVLIWYLLTIALSHLVFDRGGREGIDAIMLASWLAVLLVMISGALLGYFIWSSLALAVSLGVFLFVLPVLLILLLGRLGSPNA